MKGARDGQQRFVLVTQSRPESRIKTQKLSLMGAAPFTLTFTGRSGEVGGVLL